MNETTKEYGLLHTFYNFHRFMQATDPPGYGITIMKNNDIRLQHNPMTHVRYIHITTFTLRQLGSGARARARDRYS